jgi:hypothetical protein
MSVKAMSLVGLDVHARQTHAGVLVPDTGEMRVDVLRVTPVEVVSFLEGLGSTVLYKANWSRRGLGWSGSLYLAARHFGGWYMVNVLDLPSEDVALALGHTDGGELVRKLYGHRDQERALDRVTAAYGRTASFTQCGWCEHLDAPIRSGDAYWRKETGGSQARVGERHQGQVPLHPARLRRTYPG